MNGGKINSQTISEKFPELYREIFSECEIVVSSNDSLFWTGEYVRFYGGLTAMQKLPVKLYVGLEVTPETETSFASNLYGYAPYQQKFDILPFEPAKSQRLTSFLNEYIKTLFVKGKKFGFKIHILSEGHCGGGLGSTGVIMSCLAACILLLYGKIKPSDLEEIRDDPIQEQILDPKSKFNQIFRFSWRLTAIAREGESSGANSFGAMLHTFHPIVFVSESAERVKDHPSVAAYKNQLDNCRVFDELSYWGASLGDIFGLKESIAWPVDIARIWSGSMINTENILKSISKIQNDLVELRDFAIKPLARKLNFENTKEKPFFYQPLLRDTKSESSWQNYIDVLNFSSLRVIWGLGRIFKEGASESALRDFFAGLCNAHNLAQYLGSSTPILDHMYQTLIEESLRVNESIGGGAKLESIGKGGHVIFAFPPATLWEKMDKIVAKLKADTNKDIYVDWASWRDGFGKAGLVLEQFMETKKFSSFIPPDSARLSIYNAGKMIQRKIITYQEKEKLHGSYKIFLDAIENKIYFCGNKINSREIPSASATIATLISCLRSESSSIKNSDLPDSYSQSRYDLQSKIIIPFTRACEKYCQTQPNFKIHGEMYDNYSLYLETNNLEIAITEAMGYKCRS